MGKEFYITKTFQLSDVRKAEGEEAEKFLGTVRGYISTTHKDDQGDILTKNFVRGITKTLKDYTSVFDNHKTGEDPIAVMIDIKLKKMEEKEEEDMLTEKDTHHYGAFATIGISKTVPKKWMLIQEGILNKFSIGGYLTDFTYDEEKDAFIVDKGKIMEASLVGVPANNHAGLTDVLKTLRKDYKQNRLKVTKNMDNDEYTAIIKEALAKQALETAKQLDEFKSNLVAEQDEKLAQEKALAEKQELEDEMANLKKLTEESELVNKALAEEIAGYKEGRKTGVSHAVGKSGAIDEYFIDDPLLALHKGFRDFGSIMKSEEPFRITLVPSEVKGRFTKYIRSNHLEF